MLQAASSAGGGGGGGGWGGGGVELGCIFFYGWGGGDNSKCYPIFCIIISLYNNIFI